MFGLLLSLLGLAGLSPVPFLSEVIGATEPALKLLISILLGYPLAVIYHKYVKQNVEYRNLYFILTGCDMAFYNFGVSMYHNAIPALVIYLSTKILGPGKYNAIVTFAFNITYLLAGYVVTESEDSDITWTMPHCVLTLKLIALSFDVWDGKKMLKGEELSANNKLTALESPPTFLELLGFVYFPACFLVRPIFSFRRYKDFISDKFPLEKEDAIIEAQAVKRMIQGVIYFAACQIGVTSSMKYMLSNEFLDTSVYYRNFYCRRGAYFVLYKYISCWLLTEDVHCQNQKRCLSPELSSEIKPQFRQDIRRKITYANVKQQLKGKDYDANDNKIKCNKCTFYDSDNRNGTFGQLIAEEFKYIKPCVRTKCYIEILKYLQEAKGNQSYDIKTGIEITGIGDSVNKK